MIAHVDLDRALGLIDNRDARELDPVLGRTLRVLADDLQGRRPLRAADEDTRAAVALHHLELLGRAAARRVPVETLELRAVEDELAKFSRYARHRGADLVRHVEAHRRL